MWHRLILLTSTLVLFLSANLFSPPAAALEPNQAALDVIAELNAWRLQEGFSPLKPNATLEAMATAQAEYILSLPDIPDGGAIHDGRSGEPPEERAKQAPYNWPTYGRPDRVAITEIAYVGSSAAKAIEYWKSSSTHRSASLNPAYREIGAAALPHRFGYLFIVVYGSRPNILPALVDPAKRFLYLTTENFFQPAGGTWIGRAVEVEMFDGEGRPIDHEVWQPTLALPDIAGDTLYVAYSDGEIQTLTEVHLSEDRVLLPGNALVVLPEAQATAQPSNLSLSSAATQPPTPTLQPPDVSQEPPSPTAADTVRPEALLVYDAHALTLVNVAGHPIDLSGLELIQGTIRLPMNSWQQFSNVALNNVPAGDCF